MTCYAVARTTVEGLHCWASQPAGAPRTYLAQPHRHLFTIEVGIPVSHGDREVEILALAATARQTLAKHYGRAVDGEVQFGARSCEDIATFLGEALSAAFVRVYEDDENGAEWHAERGLGA